MFDLGEDPYSVAELLGPAGSLPADELLRNVGVAMAMASRMEWERYTAVAELHRRQVEPEQGTESELRALDPMALCASRVAAAQQITQSAAQAQITRALALRDRLPMVNDLLRRGLVAAHHIATIVGRTDLIDGSEHMAAIDRDIAERVERGGSWSRHRMRDMVDAIIFRRDPDLVRSNREDAKKNRGVWANSSEHGMAVLDAHGTAEEVAVIMARLQSLAMATCKADPRTKSERMADALFATVMGREFRCECPDDPKYPCTAEIVTVAGDQVVSGVDLKIVLHVIADQATIDGTADNPGFLEGHGVISGDHARDIAARPEVTRKVIGNRTRPAEPAEAPVAQPESPTRPETAPEPASAPVPSLEFAPQGFVRIPLPPTQPGDGYRPSSVLDWFVRIRDLYCMWPGCERTAWTADLDHTREYNHDDPADGGCTHPSEMKALCRFHHLLKTYSDWLDDQQPDTVTGVPRLVFTVEDRDFLGPAWTGDDLFPDLRLIVFDTHPNPPNRPPPETPPPDTPRRRRSRTAVKHARRQRERLLNRARRLAEQEAARQRVIETVRRSPPPPF